MLYGLSQNLCQNSAKTVWKTQHEQLLVNRVVRPSKFVLNCTDCTEIHSKIYYSSCLDFCANKCCTAALECMPILRNCSCCPPRFLCTLNAVRPPQIHTVRPVFPCCLLPWKLCQFFALGCVLSFSKCCLFSSAQPLSFSLMFSQQEWLNYPRMGAPSCPSQPHEGRWRVF